MKKQIRQGVFETNSSSTHSICIAKEAELIIPKELHFEFGEFGWEFRTLQSVEEKASYLYTGLKDNDRLDDFNNIVETLKNKGIEVTFEEQTGKNSWDNGYIDHSDELGKFLNDICIDSEKLMKFLFSPLSFILTGNDNIDEDDRKAGNNVTIDVKYEHDKYFKGN